MNRRSSGLLLIVGFASLSAACASAPAAPPPVAAPAPSVAPAPAPAPVVDATPRVKPKLGSFGVDLAGADPTVPAGTDFFLHAGGRWIKENKIPGDRSRWGMFDMLRDAAEENIRAILDEQRQGKLEKGTSAQKAGDFYAAYLDTAAIDQKGFAPAKADL